MHMWTDLPFLKFECWSCSWLDSFNGTVASGKKLKGCLFYELSNEWNELEIDISIGLSKEDEVKFLFTK